MKLLFLIMIIMKDIMTDLLLYLLKNVVYMEKGLMKLLILEKKKVDQRLFSVQQARTLFKPSKDNNK